MTINELKANNTQHVYVDNSLSLQKYAKAILRKINDETKLNFKQESLNDNVLLLSGKLGNVPVKMKVQFVFKDNKTLQAILCELMIDKAYETETIKSFGYPIGENIDKSIKKLKEYKEFLDKNKIIPLSKDSQEYFKCCLCGKIVKGYGNNPRPLKDEGKCCDECNVKYVIPARIIELEKEKE